MQGSRSERLLWAGTVCVLKAIGKMIPVPFFICLILINMSQLRKQIERLNDTYKVTAQERGGWGVARIPTEGDQLPWRARRGGPL